ncbi:MAG: dihydrodipicolinate synthase family protein, partial [Acidobacteriaceae bacterium]|nr:dihydrodipicolinate synthase family protein [Acidobacteriaceae bacterium]
QPTIRTFCLQAAEAVAKEVPVYLYNVPMGAFGMSTETCAELLASGLFAGIADASGEWECLQTLLQMRGEGSYLILSGNDHLATAAARAGGNGAVSEVACAVPELMAALWRAVKAGDEELTSRLDSRVGEFVERIQPFPVPYGIREAARQRDVKVGVGATPLGRDEEEALAAFGEWFKDWLPGVLRECR